MNLVYRFQRLFRTRDFFQDSSCGSGPDERFWAGIVLFEVAHDGGLEIGDALEDAAAYALSGDGGEEPLDHVDPGCRGGGEVEVEPSMRLEPPFHRRRLVRGVVVDDEVEIEISQRLLVDTPEEAQELARPVARHARTDDLAVQHPAY